MGTPRLHHPLGQDTPNRFYGTMTISLRLLDSNFFGSGRSSQKSSPNIFWPFKDPLSRLYHQLHCCLQVKQIGPNLMPQELMHSTIDPLETSQCVFLSVRNSSQLHLKKHLLFNPLIRSWATVVVHCSFEENPWPGRSQGSVEASGLLFFATQKMRLSKHNFVQNFSATEIL